MQRRNDCHMQLLLVYIIHSTHKVKRNNFLKESTALFVTVTWGKSFYWVVKNIPAINKIMRFLCVCWFVCLFWPCHMACGILVPQPGIEPRPSAVRARSPNHWITREFPNNEFWRTISLTSLRDWPLPSY